MHAGLRTLRASIRVLSPSRLYGKTFHDVVVHAVQSLRGCSLPGPAGQAQSLSPCIIALGQTVGYSLAVPRGGVAACPPTPTGGGGTLNGGIAASRASSPKCENGPPGAATRKKWTAVRRLEGQDAGRGGASISSPCRGCPRGLASVQAGAACAPQATHPEVRPLLDLQGGQRPTNSTGQSGVNPKTKKEKEKHYFGAALSFCKSEPQKEF